MCLVDFFCSKQFGYINNINLAICAVIYFVWCTGDGLAVEIHFGQKHLDLGKGKRKEKLDISYLLAMLELLTGSQGCNLEQKLLACCKVAQQKFPPPLRVLHFLAAGITLGDQNGLRLFFSVAKKKKKKTAKNQQTIPRIYPAVSVCWPTQLMTRQFPVQLWPSFCFTNPVPEMMWYGVCPSQENRAG